MEPIYYLTADNGADLSEHNAWIMRRPRMFGTTYSRALLAAGVCACNHNTNVTIHGQDGPERIVFAGGNIGRRLTA